MKRGSKRRHEVQDGLPACLLLPLTCFCISPQRAWAGKEAEAAGPPLARDFSYRRDEMQQLLWKKQLCTGIPRRGEAWCTLAFTGKNRGTARLGKQPRHRGVPRAQQKGVTRAGGCLWHPFGVTVLLHGLCGEPAESAPAGPANPLPGAPGSLELSHPRHPTNVA